MCSVTHTVEDDTHIDTEALNVCGYTHIDTEALNMALLCGGVVESQFGGDLPPQYGGELPQILVTSCDMMG